MFGKLVEGAIARGETKAFTSRPALKWRSKVLSPALQTNSKSESRYPLITFPPRPCNPGQVHLDCDAKTCRARLKKGGPTKKV
jgi:hypothetical protein